MLQTASQGLLQIFRFRKSYVQTHINGKPLCYALRRKEDRFNQPAQKIVLSVFTSLYHKASYKAKLAQHLSIGVRCQGVPSFPRCPYSSDGAGAYATHQYRDLFRENGHASAANAAKISEAFQQLFHGDSTQAIYFADGRNANGPLTYVSDVPHHDIRNESMSYTMMITVQPNKKAVFDSTLR